MLGRHGDVYLKLHLLRRQKQKDYKFKDSLGKVIKILSQMQNRKNGLEGWKAGVVAVIECLPSMWESLSSIPSTMKAENKEESNSQTKRKPFMPKAWSR
jgi:hypothetical protein